jgi:hypothetical protein
VPPLFLPQVVIASVGYGYLSVLDWRDMVHDATRFTLFLAKAVKRFIFEAHTVAARANDVFDTDRRLLHATDQGKAHTHITRIIRARARVLPRAFSPCVQQCLIRSMQCSGTPFQCSRRRYMFGSGPPVHVAAAVSVYGVRCEWLCMEFGVNGSLFPSSLSSSLSKSMPLSHTHRSLQRPP